MFYHIRFKACRKCGGDVSLEEDIYGTYYQCIQCGATWHAGDILTRDRVNISRAPRANKMAEPSVSEQVTTS